MSKMIERELPPSTDVVSAELQRENFSWSESLAELIDNAFDANAKRCSITAISPRCLIVDDDGDGTSDPVVMFQQGHSTSRGKNKAGRYGIGFKHASFYIAGRQGRTTVHSIHGGLYRRAEAVWGNVIDGGRWVFGEYAPEPASEGPIIAGTRVEFMNSERSLPTGKNLEPIKTKLCELFTPGLSRLGLQIVVGNQRLLPCREPEWVESISSTITFGKREAHVRFGLLPPEMSMRRGGLSYTFKHRVILCQSSLGCGEHSTAGVSGVVDLNEHWTLGQHKSEIRDEHADELYAEVLKRIAPLLEKASKQSSSMQFNQLKSNIEELVNWNIGQAKRPFGNKSNGSVSPKDTPRTVKQALIVGGEGSVRSRNSKRTGKVTVDWIDDPTQPICIVDTNTFKVTINRSFDFITRAQSENNQDAIAAIVASAFVNAVASAGTIQKTIIGLPNEKTENRFSWGLSSLLRSRVTSSECSVT